MAPRNGYDMQVIGWREIYRDVFILEGPAARQSERATHAILLSGGTEMITSTLSPVTDKRVCVLNVDNAWSLFVILVEVIEMP